MNIEYSNSPFLIQLVSICVSASEKAGLAIRRVISEGNLKVVNKASKGRFDPQTEADRSAQICIEKSLQHYFPNLKIICEEGNIKDNAPEDMFDEVEASKSVLKEKCPEVFTRLNEDCVVVWVDPLDGTKSFVKGEYKHVTVSIGIATVDGESIAGIIHQPFFCELPVNYAKKNYDYSFCTSRTIWGILGNNIHGLTSRRHLRVSESVILISKSHQNSKDVAVTKILSFKRSIASSGAAYKALCILEDEADLLIYTSGGTKKWDTCAIDALFKINGGNLTDLYGSQIDYSPQSQKENTLGVVASVKNHHTYIKKLSDSILK